MKKPLGHFSDEPRETPLRETVNDALLLQVLDPRSSFKLLPTNYLPAFMPHLHPKHVTNRAGLLARRPYNYLGYVVFSGRNLNEVRYYFRTPAGDRFLMERGYLAGLRRPAARNRHQALVDLWKASLRLGVKTSTLTYRHWDDLVQRPKMPERTKNSDHPFRLYLGDEYAVPDDAPFTLSNEKGGMLFLVEMDCNSEQITRADEKNTIEGKLQMYRDLLKARVPHRQYGVNPAADAVKLIIVTVTQGRREAIKRKIFDVFGGACPSILLGLIENHPKIGVTPPITTKQFTEPYQRAGLPDFSLAALSDVKDAD